MRIAELDFPTISKSGFTFSRDVHSKVQEVLAKQFTGELSTEALLLSTASQPSEQSNEGGLRQDPGAGLCYNSSM